MNGHPTRPRADRERACAPRRRRAGYAALTLAAGLAAGCSGQQPTPVATPSSPTAAVAPSPTVVAADGTDVGACADADCQILIGDMVEVRPRPPIDVDGILLTYIAPNRLSIGAGRGSRYIDCDLTGTGYLSIAWGVTVTVETYTGDGAIVRLTPEAEKDDAHTGSGTEGFSLNGN